jgi:SsrA-binding protein
MGAKPKTAADDRKVIASNKKAKVKFEIVETFDAGLALLGTEVKSLREGRASIDEAFARVQGDEVFLLGMHIPEYSHGNQQNHDPYRKRKLLLHRREIGRLRASSEQKGLTLVPLSLWFSPRGLAKLTLAICRGKKVGDKRETLRTKEAKREMRRAL